MSGFSNPVANAAGTLIRNVLKSANYVAGSLGWQVSKDGNAEFNSGIFRGPITTGTPGGAQVVINASPVPAELVAAYNAAHNLTVLAPERLIGVILRYDNGGVKYTYEALAIDSSVTPVVSPVTGAYDGVTVTEYTRFTNFGSGAYRTFFEANIIQAQTGSVTNPALTVLAASTNGDVDDRFRISAGGDLSWGNGAVVPDTKIYRNGVGKISADLTAGFFVNNAQLVSGEVVFNQLSFATAGTIAVAGPAAMPGSPTLNFTKVYANTRLVCHMNGTFYSNPVAGVQFGINVPGVSNTMITAVNAGNSSALSHTPYSGVAILSGVFPAGNYSAVALWGRTSASGTAQVDANDTLSFSVREIP